ncbi:MAG: hypothetical protein HKN18_04215 [Silicimonas sp.]|nr:hypothetical protein [Silicimonas sp.]
MKRTTILAIAVIMTAGSASAKGHDQGQTDVPGASVGSETVGPAHTLGGARGNRPDDKGPTKARAVDKAGR